MPIRSACAIWWPRRRSEHDMTKLIVDGHEIEARIDQYSHKADVDDAGILDPAHMVAAE